MPWRETSPVDQRERFIRDHRLDLYTMVELCARYGVSRKTGYKWRARYEEHGRQGLRNRSRAPHHAGRRRRQRRHPPRWPKHLQMFRGNLMSESYIWLPDGQADRPACAPWRGRSMLRVDDAPRVSRPGSDSWTLTAISGSPGPSGHAERAHVYQAAAQECCDS